MYDNSACIIPFVEQKGMLQCCAYLPAVLMLKSIKFLRECTLKISWHVLCCEDIVVPFKKKND